MSRIDPTWYLISMAGCLLLGFAVAIQYADTTPWLAPFRGLSTKALLIGIGVMAVLCLGACVLGAWLDNKRLLKDAEYLRREFDEKSQVFAESYDVSPEKVNRAMWYAARLIEAGNIQNLDAAITKAQGEDDSE